MAGRSFHDFRNMSLENIEEDDINKIKNPEAKNHVNQAVLM